MKTILLLLVFSTLAAATFAQGRKLEVSCEVASGNVNYGDLNYFLPDSLKSKTLIQVKKLRTLSELGVVNLMTLHGWKLTGLSHSVSSLDKRIGSDKVYLLKKEIEVSDEEYVAILNRMREHLR